MYDIWDNLRMRGADEHYDREDLERAYRKGCEDGWRKAMKEVGFAERDGGYGDRENFAEREGGYGNREDFGSRESFGERGSGYGQRAGYGEREHNGYGYRSSGQSMPDSSTFDVLGERRGVKGTGPYSRMRR